MRGRGGGARTSVEGVMGGAGTRGPGARGCVREGACQSRGPMARMIEHEEGAADAEETRSRSDSRRERRELEAALVRLARELIRLSDRKLELLRLPDEVLDTVNDARAITSAPALNRQLRVVRSALRDANWVRIRDELDSLLQHGVIRNPQPEGADAPGGGREGEWMFKLVGGGVEALDAFVRDYPKTDRGHLRNLVKSVQRASGERRSKAEAKLCRALQELLRHG